MNEDIPCVLDDIIYLKPRCKLLTSKYLWKFNTGIINKKYPVINEVEDWPAVKSGVISKEKVFILKSFFVNKFLILKFWNLILILINYYL